MSDKTPGIDISRYQVVTDWSAVASRVKFVAIRATVGDYYTDTSFESHWKGAGASGLLRAAYHVIAPADATNARQISADAQMALLFRALEGKDSELPIVLDCELARGQTKDYITSVTAKCIDLVYKKYGKYPLIYTRKSWFDYYTVPHPYFSLCDLHAARYSLTLTGPWSDGYYKFRDWTTWRIWQYSESGVIPGITGPVDLDWFNGSVSDLLEYAGRQTIEQRLAILEREALLHGWNLAP
jgi:GH25 family lysozyme M1 (1,4-beta-N-acetylmuramidase)